MALAHPDRLGSHSIDSLCHPEESATKDLTLLVENTSDTLLLALIVVLHLFPLFVVAFLLRPTVTVRSFTSLCCVQDDRLDSLEYHYLPYSLLFYVELL